MPWLLWCFGRQTWPHKELIVVDSSREPLSERRADVRVLAVPPGSNVPAKRNIALGAARGRFVAWFDDDDWQHPARLEEAVPLLTAGASLASAGRSWFVDLLGDGIYPYRSRDGIIFNSAVFAADLARDVRFDERVARASDAAWLAAVTRRAGDGVRALAAAIHTIWLCHNANLSNPRARLPLCFPIALAKRSVGELAWRDTDAELAALRARLKSSTVA
jgi:glycosyltransferase involved in cell wall biosynthesis